MEATEAYGLIYKLMHSRSQKIREQMIARTRRKRATFLIMALCGAMAATSVRRCMWMRGH